MECPEGNRRGRFVNDFAMVNHFRPAPPTQSSGDNLLKAPDIPDRVYDFRELRQILLDSCTDDVYCRSPLYFAFTGRGIVWTVKHENCFIVLLPHPNVDETLLVFFPSVSSACELARQVNTLFSFKLFLKTFREVLLARIPEPIAEETLKGTHHLDCGRFEKVDERIMDWVFPSYDVLLERLVDPKGGKLKTYRKKIRRFQHQDVLVIKAKTLGPRELKRAVADINKNWIRTKRNNEKSYYISDISPRELMECYQTMVRINSDITSEMDGLVLKRGNSYLAFSFWERLRHENAISCFAALPCSHEKGLSEYLYHCVADQLIQEGYKTMCIGGSETAGLDHFKRKFAPSHSHPLRTIRLSIHD
jgi:hypothetical protein